VNHITVEANLTFEDFEKRVERRERETKRQRNERSVFSRFGLSESGSGGIVTFLEEEEEADS
jgi:hypothetical protein